jgi:hypothetical protein
MSLQPRVSRLAVGILVLLTPLIAWAAGSPDETLKPPQEPPSRASTIAWTDQTGTSLSNTRPLSRLTTLQRLEIYYNVLRLLAYRS